MSTYFIVTTKSMVIFTIFCGVLFINSVSMENYSFFKITAFNTRDRALLYWMHMWERSIIFMNLVTNEAALPIHVIVQESFKTSFKNALTSYSVQFVEVSGPKVIEPPKAGGLHNSFLNLDKIEIWLESLEKTYTHAEKQVVGLSYKKHEIIVLKVSTREGSKPGVLVTGGEDGKDFMSVAVVLNYIYELIHNYTNILNQYDFYFMPVCNPDGYQYAMNKERFWSKNLKRFYRKEPCTKSLSPEIGVNIDRNWYLSKDLYDTSSELVSPECAAVNIGPYATSEEESVAVFRVVNKLATNLMAYINVRGTGGIITIPYAGVQFEPPMTTNNHNLMMEILSSVTEKLHQEFNTNYVHGTTRCFFYNFCGNSADFVKLKMNIPIVFTVHLENIDRFIPDPDEIPMLTSQLVTMLNETLVMAKDIYGPLFNNRTNLKQCLSVMYVVPVMLILLLIEPIFLLH